MSESGNQSRIRQHYADLGYRLWRNNSGVLPNEHGTPVRYGLANESKPMNDRVKSHDLIGWRPRLVTPDMVGEVVAIFVSIDAKPDGWRLTPGDKRGQAQARWARMVLADGGEAGFMIDPLRGFERF